MKKFPIMLFSAVFAFSANCFAKESINCYYDAVNTTLEITGTVGESENAPVSMTVFNQKTDEDFSENNVPDMFFVYTTGENGSISISEGIDDALASGSYAVYLNAPGGSANGKFMYVNENDSKTIDTINLINSADTASQVRDILLGNSGQSAMADTVGIDIDDSLSQKYLGGFIDDIIEIRSSLASNEFTPDSFIQSYSKYISAALINDGEVETALKQYASYYGTSYEEYDGLDAEVKSELDSVLEDFDFDVSKLEKQYSDCLVLAYIKTSSDRLTLQEYIEKYSDDIGIDMSDIKEIKESMRYKVYSAMLKEIDGFDSLEDVSESYEKNVEDVLEDAESGKSSGKGGGGSSAGSYYPVTVPQEGIEIPVQEETRMIEFSDVKGNFAEEYIYFLANKGVINGYSDGTFRPGECITRAEFAKMISILFEIKASDGETFSDVGPSHWCREHIGALSSAKIILGYDGKFNPDARITRQDSAVIAKRCADRFGKALNGSAEFSDASLISEYAMDAVGALYSNGIMQGDGGTFRPFDSITRAEAAAVLCRIYEKLN